MSIIRKKNGINLNPEKTGIINSFAGSSNIGGTTAETVLSTVLIPANTFKLYDIIRIESRLRKDNNNDIATIRIRIGTTESISSTLAGVYTSTASNHNYIPITRYYAIENLSGAGSGTKSFPASFSLAVQSGVADVESNLAIDWTVDNYVVLTGRLSNASDVMNLMYIVVDQINGA